MSSATVTTIKPDATWGSDISQAPDDATKIFKRVMANVTQIEGVPMIQPTALASADGAISLKHGTVYITKGSAAALTLAAPTAGAASAGGDDGKTLNIISTTAFAHTITQTTPGFNNGGSASDVATFGAAVGNNINLQAYNGVWYVRSVIGVTLG